MKRAIFLLLPIISLVLAGVAVDFASAQTAVPPVITDDQVNAIAHQLYCPVCENIPLDVCPTQACAEWRELIRQKLAAGWTEQQIKDYFVEQYGDRVIGAPPARGLNWLVYVIPPIAIVAGVIVLALVYRAWRRPLPAAKSDGTPADDYLRRMEEELEKSK